jgi:hypothetical protein
MASYVDSYVIALPDIDIENFYKYFTLQGLIIIP